jgi:hypothetical protein
MENTLTIYLSDTGEERRRRRRRRLAAAILAGGVIAALAKGTPKTVGASGGQAGGPGGGTTGVHVETPVRVVRVEPDPGPVAASEATRGPDERPPDSQPPVLRPAKAVFSPSSGLDFADGPLVRGAAAQLATVRNDGGTPIERVTVKAKRPFVVTNGCRHGLAPGAECVVAVVFAPGEAGRFEETLHIAAGSESARIRLRGRATEPVIERLPPEDPPPQPPQLTPRVLCFQPESLRFVSPGTKAVTLTNPEDTPLDVTKIRILRNGVEATGYTVDTASCVGLLQPHQPCRLAVTASLRAMLLHETVKIAVDYVDPASRETRAVHRATSCGR